MVFKKNHNPLWACQLSGRHRAAWVCQRVRALMEKSTKGLNSQPGKAFRRHRCALVYQSILGHYTELLDAATPQSWSITSTVCSFARIWTHEPLHNYTLKPGQNQQLCKSLNLFPLQLTQSLSLCILLHFLYLLYTPICQNRWQLFRVEVCLRCPPLGSFSCPLSLHACFGDISWLSLWLSESYSLNAFNVCIHTQYECSSSIKKWKKYH